MPTLRTLGPPYPISTSSRPTSPPSASGSHFSSSPLHESTQSASPVSRHSPDLILSSESSGQATEHALFREDSPLPASSSQLSQPTSPTAADDHVSRFASSFGSKSKPNPLSSASRAPGIPLFSAFSVLSRKGKKRATMPDALVADISNDGAPPPVPPKDRVVSAPVSAATSTRLQISFPLGNRTPSPSPHRGNGLSYAPRTEDDAHSSRSYGEDENDDLVARTGPGFRSAHPSNAAGGSSGFFHRRHFSGGSAKGGQSARRASLSSVISGGGGSGGYHRRGPSEISHSDAYDAYDTLYGAVAPALTPSTARMGSLDLSQPPRLPSALQQLNSPGGTRSVSTPVHAAYSTGRSVFAGGTIDPSSSLSSASALSPTSATSPSSAPPPSALSPTTSSPSAFSTISRLRAGSDSDCLSPASTWLSQQTNLRRESDREALRERLERDGPERRRLKEEEKLRLEKEREERVSERLERARETTARLMEEERVRREEEKRRTEKERLERSEEEEKEMIRIRAELGRAREEGGRLADGVSLGGRSRAVEISADLACTQWLTVQAPGSVLFRRRYFHISPLKLELFKNAEVGAFPSFRLGNPSDYRSTQETAEPLMTIHLPSSGGKLAITDAYEEIQVLHSFRMGAKDGQGWLFYLDSESDKAIVVEAVGPDPSCVL